MKTKILMLSCVSLLGLTAAASAAPGYTWTGMYVGLSGGYGDHTNRHEDVLYESYGHTSQYRQDGWLYGAQIGHNWQDRNTAWGLELDFYGTSIDREVNYSDADEQIQNEVEWLASLRKRKGFAFGDTFFYSTFGVAVGEFEGAWLQDGDAANTWVDTGNTRIGAIAGFGIERKVGGNWSVRTQFTGTRYIDDEVILNPDLDELVVDDTVFAGTIGVNYAFGGDGGSGSKFVAGTPFSFAGFFVGVGLGGHQSTVQASDVDYEWFGGTYDLLADGVVGSVQAGYNSQINGFVFGIEGDVRWYDGDNFATDGSATTASSLDWGGNVKFKAGVAADDLLMYLVGGYAFGDYELVHQNSGDIWDLGGMQSGFIVGAGLEQGITPNLTARLEATYTGLNGDSEVSPTEPFPFRGAAQDIAIMAGLNYYLGDRGSMGTGALAPVKWEGFYAGLDALFAYHMGQIVDRSYFEYGGTYAIPSFGAGFGGHVGYDWQDDTFVYGLIADVSAFSNDELDSVAGYREMASSLNFMGTLRGRAGVATGQGLIFATAGVAYADIDLSHQYLPAPDVDSFIFDNDRIGWTAGLGVEKAMSDNSSFKFEILYTSFGKEDANNADLDVCDGAFATELCTMEGHDDTITASVGYSWRWGK